LGAKRIKGNCIEIHLQDLFGVKLQRNKSKTKKPGSCQGVELHTFVEGETNKLKHDIISLIHPSEETCKRWVEEIDAILQSMCIAFPAIIILYNTNVICMYDAV